MTWWELLLIVVAFNFGIGIVTIFLKRLVCLCWYESIIASHGLDFLVVLIVHVPVRIGRGQRHRSV